MLIAVGVTAIIIVVALMVLLMRPAEPAAAPAKVSTATGGKAESPTRFHYGFTFVTLPSLVLKAPEVVHKIESDPSSHALWRSADGPINGVWRRMAKDLGVAGLPDLRVSIEEQPWGKAILIVLPEPTEMPLAHFIAIVPRGPGKALYLTLEKSVSGTMIGGVVTVPGHVNFGSGPEPDAEAFLEAIGKIVTAEK